MIRCVACDSPLDATRDLVARRFLLGDAQRGMPPSIFLLAATEVLHVAAPGIPEIDYSRAVFQHLYACPSCLSLVRADRPARADDVVPGRLSLAVPGAIAVRAARRLESAAASGRIREELRALRADPLRRYVLRIPRVFRAARAAFHDELLLVSDAITAPPNGELVSPHGVAWDMGPNATPEATARAEAASLLRLVRRAANPFDTHGSQSFQILLAVFPGLVQIHRRVRLLIVGEYGFELRVRAHSVKAREYPTKDFLVPLDLVRPL